GHHPPHPVGPRRGQARCARPRRVAVQPARLQHRVAGRRADGARERQPHDDRRRRRGLAPRAGDQAAEQAHQRPEDRGARPRVERAARAAAREGQGRPHQPQSRARDGPAVPGQGRRRRRRRGDDRGHRHDRQARRPDPGARAVRHPRARAVGHGRRRTGIAFDDRRRDAPAQRRLL
ncbi:MAG: Acetolactate synthase small subunit, partial [uncultured Frankineae bacterium]